MSAVAVDCAYFNVSGLFSKIKENKRGNKTDIILSIELGLLNIRESSLFCLRSVLAFVLPIRVVREFTLT